MKLEKIRFEITWQDASRVCGKIRLSGDDVIGYLRLAPRESERGPDLYYFSKFPITEFAPVLPQCTYKMACFHLFAFHLVESCSDARIIEAYKFQEP